MTPKADNQMPPPTPIQPLPPPITKPKTEPSVSHQVNLANGITSNGFFPMTAPPLASPMPTPDMPRVDGIFNMPAQSGSETNKKSRQHNYVMPQTQPQAQPEMWNNSQSSQAPPVPQTSSTMNLFRGVDSLIQDQEWWLRDSNQMFANWNGMEQEAMMQGNAGFDGSTGNVGYGNGVYGMNGNERMNGNAQMNG